MNKMEFPGGLTIGIALEEDKKDPQQRGAVRVADPLRHGNNMEASDYPYLSAMGAASQTDLETNSPPPEAGTVIICMSQLGNPSKIPIAISKDVHGGGPQAGNLNNVAQIKKIKAAIEYQYEKVLSKGFQTKTRDGAEVREPKDGEKWAHKLTKGIPVHAAMPSLAGTIIPSRASIETAKQKFDHVLNSSMLSKLPGSFMSLSSMFDKLTSSQKKNIKKNVPEDVFNALESTMALMQNGDSGSSMVSGRVDEETFIANAIELLSRAKTLPDVESALHRLTYDDTLFGLDKLKEVEIEIEGVFGKFKQKLDAAGNITDEIPEIVKKIIEAFSSFLKNAEAASGGNTGLNLFGDQSDMINDMLGRVSTDVDKFRKTMLETLNKSPDAQKFKKILDKSAWKGGNPLSILD